MEAPAVAATAVKSVAVASPTFAVAGIFLIFSS
jgi:hypothetical protein